MILLWVLFRPISLKLFCVYQVRILDLVKHLTWNVFVKIVYDFQTLTNFAKRSMLDASLGSEFASLHLTVFKSNKAHEMSLHKQKALAILPSIP